jgi:hypothetical protein
MWATLVRAISRKSSAEKWVFLRADIGHSRLKLE